MTIYYAADIDLSDLDISIDDLVDLALEQGEDLYTRDELAEKVEEGIAEFVGENTCYTPDELETLEDQAFRKGEEHMEKYCLAGDHSELYTEAEFTKEIDLVKSIPVSNLDLRVQTELKEMSLRIAAIIRGDI